jgi:hypothetical protein
MHLPRENQFERDAHGCVSKEENECSKDFIVCFDVQQICWEKVLLYTFLIEMVTSKGEC